MFKPDITTRSKTEILETGDKTGTGLTLMTLGSQRVTSYTNLQSGFKLMNYSTFKFSQDILMLRASLFTHFVGNFPVMFK